jgi:archaellin
MSRIDGRTAVLEGWSMVKRIKDFVRRVREERGITGLETAIAYIDDTVNTTDMIYTVVEIVGDNDSLLEQGELAQIDIDMTAECGCSITENETFTLELKPPTGSYLVVQRTTPASVNESIINLN